MIIETTPVEYQPSVEVFHWTIVKLKDKDGNVSEHVAGHEDYSYARVSTAIQEQGEGFAVTASGRKYLLKGPEAKHPTRNAAYVLEAFKRINGLESVENE